ncbi:MAG: amidase family protein [Pseudoprimorskyibacter sp.]|nr:amidase family protein [Pseudoprimorskyibacter sp.]
MIDWTVVSATHLGAAIERGEADPEAVTLAYLNKIAQHPLRDRIYARLTPERAMSEARASAQRARDGRRKSRLDGVPVSWKDLFDTAGIATEAGSALLAGRVPGHDADVLSTATALGLVCLGKTHMSELAFSGLGLNPMTATAPCIHDTEAVSGGSSSGAAASVAFGLAAAAVGSDTGGSVRIPAAWNDLVGLKTTTGVIPLTGVVPLCEKFDTVGPLTRTVADAAAVYAALTGTADIDLTGADLRGVRLASLQTLVMDDIRDAPRAAYASAVERLAAAGAEIEPIDAPELESPMAQSALLYTAEAWGIWGQTIMANPDAMFEPIRDRFIAGADYKASDYVKAWREVHQAREIWAVRTAGFDAVICPTAPILPPKAGQLMTDNNYYVAENLLALRNTRVGNLMGTCALTLPTGVPSCGLQLIGNPLQEARLLRLGHAAEAALA